MASEKTQRSAGQLSSFLLRAWLLLTLLCSPQTVLADSDEAVLTEWEIWKSINGINYDERDDVQRRVIWEENQKMIRDHNQGFLMGMRPFSLGMNKYGDLTGQEYRVLQGAVMNAHFVKRGKEVSARRLRYNARKSEAAFVDYRNMGYVTEVKDQGYCGSCWAFSTTGAIEGQIVKKTVAPWMANAYDYVLSNGLQTTDTYPYTSVDTQPCFYDSRLAAAHIKDYRFIPQGDEQALADAVATVGPITVAIDADHASFLFYSSGIYDESNCDPNRLSHAVLLVGYGSEEGQDYWIIKNSWGSSWGEGGYMRLIRNGSNTCGIASYALYPIL